MQVEHFHKSEKVAEFSGVSFSYGNLQVLQDISFEIQRGDYTGLVGPNGGGKTTVLKLMLGLLKPESGQVKIFGQDVGQVRQERAHVGYVPQRAIQADLNFPITVREVVGLGMLARKSIFGLENVREKLEIDKALSITGIADFQYKRIGELSGGQRQRALIARALASSPEMLVLDEPTVGVDQLSEQQFYELLKKLNQELGLTIVLVTHDLDVVSREVKQLIGVNKQIIFKGSLGELTKQGVFDRLYSKDKQPIYHGH